MKRNSIGFLIILATLAVVGILLTQFFFLKNSYDLNERQFHVQVTSALRSVAAQINEYNEKTFHHSQKTSETCQVEQISNNYYVVNVNDVIDSNLLEHFLEVEFRKRNLNVTYEYAIYDCNSQKMIHGNFIKRDSIPSTNKQTKSSDTTVCSQEEIMFEKHYSRNRQKVEIKHKVCTLPTCEKFTYYFGVHFPDRSEYYSTRLLTWYFLNGILFFVVIFFGYALYVIIKQKQLSEIQKNFINNLTHEFKTPIASIDLAAKVLSNPKICEQPERLAEYVKIVGQQNKRLSAHVEKLLQMATIEKTKLKLHLENIELNAFVADTIQEFKNSQNGRSYSVKVESAVENAHIKADKLHFSNLIFNILDNAIKYCHTTPEIIISLTENKRHYFISFEDNGIGIPAEERKRIFNRFYRVPTGNIHDVKGFGLGLDYVKKIVQRHGWHIKVMENTRKGTTFILETKKQSK
ncbi:MAG TPA: HAMP domain-containing sensor histidine kinase [Prolixibacteraceae bacterium]|nr:HAMP domain-containing sensor histidine kinase [Prolixibacteraceae bacterium]HPR85012.1 HAMP domain-containing sensor histidine kinase [Prolixibacteraceae bacterium]